MKISQLEYFVSAAKNLSFTRAAKECYTVQSSVSQQITSLEDELGFTLFDRSGKGLTLTPAGERYYADTQRLLAMLEENRRVAAQIAQGVKGHLKVGLSGANQSASMRPLKQFSVINPGISVSFCDVCTENQVTELMENDYDILYTAVFNMHGEQGEVAFTGRTSEVLAVFMNTEHPLAAKENITLAELAAWPNIYAAIPERGKSFATEQDLYAASGLRPVRIIRVRNHNTTNLLLDLNVGIAVAPELLLESMPRQVTCRPLEHGRFKIEMGWAYAPQNRNPALRLFLKYLEAHPPQ